MKSLAIIAGILFVAVGAAGFVPQLCPGGLLFGVFAVNEIHNGVHIATGVLALVLGLAGEAPARTFFRVIGIVYALLAAAGFVEQNGGGALMGMTMNMADDILHVAIAIAGLSLGFFTDRRVLPPPGPRHDLREWA
jgi:hypothetical protein